jgi:hypothetical protein
VVGLWLITDELAIEDKHLQPYVVNRVADLHTVTHVLPAQKDKHLIAPNEPEENRSFLYDDLLSSNRLPNLA